MFDERDDFEQNEAYYHLIDALSSGVAIDIASTIDIFNKVFNKRG